LTVFVEKARLKPSLRGRFSRITSDLEGEAARTELAGVIGSARGRRKIQWTVRTGRNGRLYFEVKAAYGLLKRVGAKHASRSEMSRLLKN
jgi:hypothetical protein